MTSQLKLQHTQHSIFYVLLWYLLLNCPGVMAGVTGSDSLKLHQAKAPAVKSDSTSNLIIIKLRSAKDTTTLTLKADSLFTLLNKTLVKRDHVDNWFDGAVNNTKRISDMSDNLKNIVLIIVAAIAGVAAWVKKKAAPTQERINLWNILILICGAVIVCVIVYYLVIILGAVILAVLRLVGYVILIAPVYWFVYNQYLRTKEENQVTVNSLTNRDIKLGHTIVNVSAMLSKVQGSLKVRFFIYQSGYQHCFVDIFNEDMNLVIIDDGMVSKTCEDKYALVNFYNTLETWFVEINNRNFV